MGIPCGEVVMTVSDLTTYRGRPVYVLNAHLYTNRAFSLFYSISDTLTSYVDAEGIFSWKYIKEIQETKDSSLEVVEYDQVNGTWTKNGQPQGEILPFTQDLLSAVYYLRALNWNDIGDTIWTPVNDTKKNYHMTFELDKQKRLRVLNDWVTARVGRPVVQLEGKYKSIGNNEVWFTDDDSRIPVLIKCNIRLGNIYAKLVEYDTGQKPLATNNLKPFNGGRQ